MYLGPNQMRWLDWPEPKPAQGQALVAVRAVGICGSDVHGYSGDSGRRTPNMIMGHEATGEVVAVGPKVSSELVGAAVIIRPFVHCETCDNCMAGAINLCRNRQFIGGNTNGAMTERMVVPEGNMLPLPKGLSYEFGTLVEPLSVAIHAVSQAGDVSGKSLFIAGCGPIGLLTLIAAKQAGARQIIVTDLLDRRLRIARELGATVTLSPKDEGWNDDLTDAIGQPEADVAFDAVGISATFKQSLQAVRPGGTVVALGGWQTVPINLGPFVARELTLKATFNFTPDEFDLARRWLKEGLLDPSRIITDIHPLSEGASVFEALSRHQLDAIKVVLNNPKQGVKAS